MNMNKTRVRLFTGLHVLILGLALGSVPSGSPELHSWADSPSANQIALYEDLIHWIDASESFDLSLRESASFELFRSFHDQETRDQFLRAVPYGERIRSVADRHGVDGFLIASVVEAESSFDPRAISHRGAIGLMQLMPATADLGPDQLVDPTLNLDLGARYLSRLLSAFHGDLELALAAYNAGPSVVRRYGGLPPYRETRKYVDKVIRLYVGHHRTVWQGTGIGELLVSS